MALIRTGGIKKPLTAAFTGYNEGANYYLYGVDTEGNNYPSTLSAFNVPNLINFAAGSNSRVLTALAPLTIYVGDRGSGAVATIQHLNTNDTYTFNFGTKTLLVVAD